MESWRNEQRRLARTTYNLAWAILILLLLLMLGWIIWAAITGPYIMSPQCCEPVEPDCGLCPCGVDTPLLSNGENVDTPLLSNDKDVIPQIP